MNSIFLKMAGMIDGTWMLVGMIFAIGLGAIIGIILAAAALGEWLNLPII